MTRMGKTRYDYSLLKQHPRVCAFLIGWTAERITCLTHYALYTSNYHEWRKARWELHRLVAICMEIRQPAHPLGREIGLCVRELLGFFGKDSFWTTTYAQSLRVYLHDDEPCGEMRGDGYPFGGYQWDTRFFPTLFCSPDELKDQMVSAPATGLLANLTRLLGKSLQKENAVAFGVNMAGLAYGRCTRDIQGDAQVILNDMLHCGLITHADYKDLLDVPARNELGIGEGPLLSSHNHALLPEDWAAYRTRKLAKILACMCGHAGMRVIPAAAIDTKRPPSKLKLAVLFASLEADQARSGQIQVQPPCEPNRTEAPPAKFLDQTTFAPANETVLQAAFLDSAIQGMPTEDGPKVPQLSQNGLVNIKEHLGGEKPDAALGDQTNSPAVADTRNKKAKRTTQKVDSFEKTADRIIEQVIDGIAGVTEAMAAKFLDQTTHTRANEPVVQAVLPVSALATKLNGIQPPKPTPEKKRTRRRPKIEGAPASYRMAILEAWKRAKGTGVSRETFCEKSIEYIRPWKEAHPNYVCPKLTIPRLENFRSWDDQHQRRPKGSQT